MNKEKIESSRKNKHDHHGEKASKPMRHGMLLLLTLLGRLSAA
jgi:hypothetical protein